MNMKRYIALFAVLTALCLMLSGCYLDSLSVLGSDGNTYKTTAAPTKGTLMLHTHAEWSIPDDVSFGIADRSYVRFVPVDGGKPVEVDASSISIVDYTYPAEGSEDAFEMTIGVEYELAPGKYKFQFNENSETGSYVYAEYYYYNEDSEVTSDGSPVGPDDVVHEITIVQSLTTGDGADLMLWAAVTLIGAAGIALMAKKRREA